ncbi:MAG: hypothetical protein QNJ51_22655 [Calothrix sp. MO_167.B12]|nr:hypothetical protein [Calothrix sp. MO_167.B12]
MPGNPFGLRHLLYAGEPVHRSGLPSTAMAHLLLITYYLIQTQPTKNCDRTDSVKC